MKTRIPPILIIFALICFALVQNTQAVSPAPDGGYPGGNTSEGQSALLSLTTGGFNTAVGFLSLRSNTTNSFNTAIGAGALLVNTADQNTATGAAALLSNTTGDVNTATGTLALFSNTTGSGNTAMGYLSLFSNTSSHGNTAVGNSALYSNTTGDGNAATGQSALYSNTTGVGNTAVGDSALSSNTTGVANTALGADALFNNATGSGNTALGHFAGDSVSTASNVICIGSNVSGADVSNTTWIGNVYGVTTQSGTTAPVIVSDSGQLGTVASSERFKKDIATMDRASEAILSLRPVTFHYKTDAKGISQFGLIAEEVAKVNPALVLPDKEGKPYTVRYDAVNAMLLNEFLKEHRKVQEQEATITQLKSTVAQQNQNFQATFAQLTARLEQQEAQIQKVSTQLEASKPAAQVVDNP
jgi:hypothetical protein